MMVMHTEILQNFCPPEFKFIWYVHFIHLLLHHCRHLHCLRLRCRRRRHHHHPLLLGIIITVVIVIISHSSRLPSRMCFLAI